MKVLKAATLAWVFETPAAAGGMSAPIMEGPVIATKTWSSSGGILIPLLFFVLLAAAVSSR